jgi:predicted small lipoprotein YifL
MKRVPLPRAGARIVVAIAALATLSGCGSAGPAATGGPSTAVQAPPPSAVSGSSPTSSAPPTASVRPSSSAASDQLTGTWTTGQVTCVQWNAAIAKGGFTAAQLKANDQDVNTHTCPATFKIRFQGGRLAIFVNDELGWNGTYKITDDHTFVAGDNCDFCVLYHFTRRGDQLSIDVVKDGDPLGPVTDHIIQTGIYESVPFTRVS